MKINKRRENLIISHLLLCLFHNRRLKLYRWLNSAPFFQSPRFSLFLPLSQLFSLCFCFRYHHYWLLLTNSHGAFLLDISHFWKKIFQSPSMDASSLVPVKDQKEKPGLLIEVVNKEKQLWGLISIKGLLHADVQELYQKVCASYEKALLSDYELVELQDVEYSLWKLHYRHIDEFRKQIKKGSSNGESEKAMIPQSVDAAQRSYGNHKERFKSFLSEATKFYQSMIVKIRKLYGLPEDLNFYRSCLDSAYVEPKKMRKFQFLCHRFLVCLGDLARYREQYERPEIKNHNWSVAVSHYLDATKIWPDSGNPQNQLAVLATYVGDEFLALYHCIRSLSVKEPFPDAWNNLILLFEKNRSSPLHFLSEDACFDFMQPSKRNIRSKSRSSSDSSNSKVAEAEDEASAPHLWPLMIRIISLFFIKSSLEDFPCTFASTIAQLDDLMTLDDVKLKVAMESYQHMGSARSGPFRILQMVSILIFTNEDLIKSPEVKEFKNNHDSKQLVLTQLALTATFIFMGRLVERSLKASSLENCPILPALLIFMEWLVNILDEVEKHGCDDDKSRSATCYFFCALLELIKKFDTSKTEVEHPSRIALWEDYELRGFAPLYPSHASLDFSTHFSNANSFENGYECRAHRIINAAMRLTDRSSNRKWLLYDKLGRKFSLAVSNKLPEEKESEEAELASSASDKCTHESAEKLAKIHEEKPSNTSEVCKSVATEEEEVILFKPLTRYNSAPLYNSNGSDDKMTPKDTGDEAVPADECLRRATSLLIAQNQAHGDPSAFHSDLTNFKRNKPLKQQEYHGRDTTHQLSEPSVPLGVPAFSTSISAGPPSLSGWVLNRGSLSNDRMKGKSDTNKSMLTPIEEVATASLNDLSISETDPFVSHRSISSDHNYSSPPYTVPTPSAPLLPDDAVWFNSAQSTFADYNRANNLFDSSQVGGYSRWIASHQLPNNVPAVPGLTDAYPLPNRMSSSEWLRQYREKQNLDPATGHTWPVNPYGIGNTGNLHGNGSTVSGLFDQWGTPLASGGLNYERIPPLHMGFPPVYGIDDQRRDKFFQGYQRPSPFVCGAVNEPEPLLQYLKEKEWLLQQDPTLRGPAYMRN